MATSASKAAPQTGQPGAGDASPAPNKLRKTLILVLGALLLAGAGGGGAWYFLGNKGESHGGPGAQKSEPAKPPVFMSLETFTVNLQAEDVQQFLQVNMTLQVADNAQVDLLKLHMPHVRNRLLILLSSKKPSEILSVEGKKKLSDEIIEQLKQPFTPQGPEPRVTDVLFTSFVVQ